MSINNLKYLKIVRSIFLNLIGWGLLISLWYKLLFVTDGIHQTLTAVKIVIIWAFTVFIFCLVWSSLNIKNLIFRNEFKSKHIRTKVKDWTWAEAVLDENDNIIKNKERSNIICKQKDNYLSSTRMLSYSAILIRDGHIKEAIGFLRQMLSDPYIGQLTRKIAESELDLIFMEGYNLNNEEE